MAEALGTTLQRGGETLSLNKAIDRFTVRPQSPAVSESLLSQVRASFCGRVPIGSREEAILLEFRVEDPAQLDAAMDRTRELEDVAFVSHVYEIQSNPGSFVYLADDITVMFDESVTDGDRSAIAAEFGLEELRPLEGLPGAFVFRVTKDATANPIKLTNALLDRDGVLAAEPNIAIRSSLTYRPDDDLYPRQWYLHHDGGALLSPNSHIDAEKAWDVTRGDRSVVVAITDDSIDIDHPDFQGIGKIVAPRDLRGKDFLPLPEAQTDNHGTACAGVCLAEETGSGIVGVAPRCALMPIRTTGYLDDDSIEELFDWASDRGASVISCSWGASAVNFRLSMRQYAAISRTASKGRDGKGCVVVFAAGNANRPIRGIIDETNWPQNVLSGNTRWLSGFATHPDVVAVSACTSQSRKAAYSNWGDEISVCAPSNNAPPGIWLQQTGYISTAPPVTQALPGLGVFTTDRVGSAGYARGDYTAGFGGTSSACPVVAGVAALVLSVNPDLTAAQVKDILQRTADKIVDTEPDPQLGKRLGTYDNQGRSPWFGYGKVNAYNAVLAAKEMREAPHTVTKRVRGTNDRSVRIPDGDLDGVLSPIRVLDDLPVVELAVNLDIDHPYLGDLELYLVAPNGETALLQGRGVGRKSGSNASYSMADTPSLNKFRGTSAQGIWNLQAIDVAHGDTGTLKRWQLTLGMG
ncbi:S8 family serine peptidase [Baaleninema simplex]|uniref:S8 family serine peptidase n=1 Tax=Baaleninema simplex TaxID=2862350 RepID=UPI0003476CEB|nr:S8 family serine peptidase [Baaleninema simplex]